MRWFVLLALSLGLASCAADRGSGRAGGAECVVCKHNHDLACIDVEVTPQTPRTAWGGQTWYFCSAACQKEFEKSPQKYAVGR